MIERHGSGGPWEPVVGYSRVVKAGPMVEVAGCTAVDAEGHIVGGSSVYDQARQALTNVVTALATVGAKPEHVIRTRLFITDITRWKDLGARMVRSSATSGRSRRCTGSARCWTHGCLWRSRLPLIYRIPDLVRRMTAPHAG
jgi:enamine deaminase RidA (YjgF/YER057c/UK114 family)